MKPFRHFPPHHKGDIRYVLTDIDDTLTIAGRLPAVVFQAMERLQQRGIGIVPVTGRPAGWCDHMARMWPIDALVGENGAFYFRYDRQSRKMIRRYERSETARRRDRKMLQALQKKILAEIPGAAVSADQAFREADLAIDFCEDVPALPQAAVDRIVTMFIQAGAQAKVSSIHVNGWFGRYDKLSMTQRLFAEVFDIDLAQNRDGVLYIGDSPNDAPMFAFFPHAVGVANIAPFKDRLPAAPTWVTTRKGGFGFAEMVDGLLS